MPSVMTRLLTLLPTIAALFTIPAHAATCESLAGLKLAYTTITVAQSVTVGSLTTPYGDLVDHLPAFCRVAGVIMPSSDSHIRFEVWLPTSQWNDRFLGVGNGGFAGTIDYRGLAENLGRGYATAATDTGHEAGGGDASWAFGHPEKVIDFGYRAVHLTAATAKSILPAFYGRPAQHAYFDSCSDGGREALMEAQRFPEDYDGILAGAPANFWTHMLASGIDVAKVTTAIPAGYIPAMKTPAITKAALAACDVQDGVKDGIINNPLACHFSPDVLLCKGEDSLSCLTAPQLASLKKLYSGGQDSHGPIFPGFMPGDEDPGWRQWILGGAPGAGYGANYLENYFRYMVYQDPVWNPLTADIDAAEQAADEKTATALNSNDPDLSAFQSRGGKLIEYHGWNDPAISPLNSINYYNRVQQQMGAEKTQSFMRLYMIPGMGHCSGGPGPNSFGQSGHTTAKGPAQGVYAALEQWVEKGTAPGEIVAAKYIDDAKAKGVKMTRPLCAYPQVARYKGTGDTNDSASFVCSSASE